MLKRFDSYLVGYYGMQNTGDDALMYSTYWGARSALNDNKLSLSSLNVEATQSMTETAFMQPSLFRGHQRLKHYQNAMQSEKVIFGGGSVIHSERDIQLKRHMIKLAGRKNSRCVGVGIDKFESIAAEKQCAKFLNECGFIGVRDPHSLEVASALAPNANIQLTFDLAPTMLTHEAGKLSNIERNGIMLNLCQLSVDAFGNLDQASEMRRLNAAAELVCKCWDTFQEPIHLVDFNGHSQFGDHNIHRSIMQYVPSYIDITHIPYDPDPYRVLQRLAGYKAIVPMRLHAAIMAFMTDTPCLPLVYHKKCEGWCEQAGVSESLRFGAKTLDVDGIIDALKDGFGTGFAKPTLSIEAAVSAAQRNWR